MSQMYKYTDNVIQYKHFFKEIWIKVYNFFA
jgi:hypothetical protein